ncbi:replication-associated protein [Circular genetic element sp.]|nr:replication-associated protein [Circular genetic element sp.]
MRTSVRGNDVPVPGPRRQGVIWLVTCPESSWKPDFLQSDPVVYAVGQHELSDGGYAHVHALIWFARKQSLVAVRALSAGNWELSRSSAAESYVWKDETAVQGSRFQFGSKPVLRSSKRDWDAIWLSATLGRVDEIPASIRISSYRAIKSIAADHMVPAAMERSISVFWGSTGTGKSRRAWEEAGTRAFPKDPNTKFWDGYRDQNHVVIDEFRGVVNISHVLRWFDRYPVIVEVKGGAVPLQATKIWITSNLHPRDWYPTLDVSTQEAFRGCLNV